MALINLRTNLKSLKYGNDRPGGGSSNQPYITKDIPDDNNKSNIFRTGGPDVLLRGGLITPLKAINDVSRLTQMFFDLKSPNGLLFIGKQNLLSRTAVKTEASKGPAYGGGGVNAGIYTPLSTIAQAGVGFTGTHLNLLGLDPSSPITGVVEGNGIFPKLGLNRYEDVVKENNKIENNSFPTETKTTSRYPNPLYLPPILGDQLPTQEPEFIEISSFKTTGGFKNRLVDIWYNKQYKQLGTDNSPNVLEYKGGPGSILGIGRTNIKFADKRTGDRNPLYTSNPSFFFGTGNKDKYLLSPQSKDISNKLLGVTKFALKLLPSEKDKSQIKNVENPNRITNKYYVLDRKSEEYLDFSRLNNKTSDSWIFPLTRGASWAYEDYIGKPGKLTFKDGVVFKEGGVIGESIITENGGYTFNQNWEFRTTISGSLESRDDIKTYQTSIDLAPIPKNKIKEDFRTQLPKDIRTLSPGYEEKGNKNIEQRVNIGDPGAGTRLNRVNYTTGRVLLDKINASSIYSGVSPDHSQSTNKNDLVKFSIGVVQSGNSEQADYMNFRAYIDSFSDSYTSDWGEVKYVGRGDKFYNYQGFDRSISMAFTIYAHSKAELIPMYKKLNYLASSLAPSYSTGGFMQGNLHRLTLGGYLYNQLGILKSVTYDVPQESTWEIGINTVGEFDSTVKELPHMIKVSNITFIPIQNFVPRRANPSNQVDTRFIALEAGTNNTSY